MFSTAAEVAALGQAWLEALSGGRAVVPAPAAAEEFARDASTPGSARALGWDTPSRGRLAIGSRLGRGPRGAIGHLGYTGCSLWLDLDAGGGRPAHEPRPPLREIGQGRESVSSAARSTTRVADGLGIG